MRPRLAAPKCYDDLTPREVPNTMASPTAKLVIYGLTGMGYAKFVGAGHARPDAANL